MTEKIGFIGLGIMGRGMVVNLLKAGFELCVWNRTAERMTPLLEAGASAGSSPADVAARSDIIITCVSDTPDVEAVILGEDGVINGVRSGSLVIDMSTISPQTTKDIAARLADVPASQLSDGRPGQRGQRERLRDRRRSAPGLSARHRGR
jgi:3-hydroxyisobutyrate dehydrogenase